MRRDEQIERLATDCIHFKGDRPCHPHSQTGEMCRCSAYCPRGEKLLFIQISSPSAVIHSLAVIGRIKEVNPTCHITYLTSYPELLNGNVNESYKPDSAGIIRIESDNFDRVYNLDMDSRACAIMNRICSENKYGFYLREGRCVPYAGAAENVYLRKIMPAARQENEHNRIRDIFLLCDMEYQMDMPRISPPVSPFSWRQGGQLVVGVYPSLPLNGFRETSWQRAQWVEFIDLLDRQGATAVLLGDLNSDTLNRTISHDSECIYPGPLGLGDLIGAISTCDVIVSTTAWISDLSMALNREFVLMNDRAVKSMPKSGEQVTAGEYRNRGTVISPASIAEDSRATATFDGISPQRTASAVFARHSHMPAQNKELAKDGDALIDAINKNYTRSRNSLVP